MSEPPDTRLLQRPPCLALALALAGGAVGGLASPFLAAALLDNLPVDRELLGPYLMVIVLSWRILLLGALGAVVGGFSCAAVWRAAAGRFGRWGALLTGLRAALLGALVAVATVLVLWVLVS